MLQKIILVLILAGSMALLLLNGNMLPAWIIQLGSKGYDKPLHSIIFLNLEVLLFFYYPTRLITIFFSLIGCGVLIELLQKSTGRYFSIGDIVADVVGLLLGLLVIYFIDKYISNLFKF